MSQLSIIGLLPYTLPNGRIQDRVSFYACTYIGIMHCLMAGCIILEPGKYSSVIHYTCVNVMAVDAEIYGTTV